MSKLKVSMAVPTEITMTRVFDAPRRLVMKAMSEPALVKRWLGGVRAEVISVDIDFRVGGRYRYAFKAHENGFQFALVGTYLEIGEDRVVNTEGMEGMPGESTNTTTWTEAGGQTTMTVVMKFPTAALRDQVASTGMADGAGESYDALEAFVQSL